MNGRRGRLQREQAIKRCQRSEAMNWTPNDLFIMRRVLEAQQDIERAGRPAIVPPQVTLSMHTTSSMARRTAQFLSTINIATLLLHVPNFTAH